MNQKPLSAPALAKVVFDAAWKGKPFPVDPVVVADYLGMRVVDAEFQSNTYGALVKRKGRKPTIILSSSDSMNRRRFTCAHEIGHYIWRSEQFADENFDDCDFEYIDFRDGRSSLGINEEEVFANQFAAELLMPKDEVLAAKSQLKLIMLLARKFGVSDEAMRIRLKNIESPERC